MGSSWFLISLFFLIIGGGISSSFLISSACGSDSGSNSFTSIVGSISEIELSGFGSSSSTAGVFSIFNFLNFLSKFSEEVLVALKI